MLFINYILIIVWLALFRMGVLSALVMLPLTILAVTLDFLLLDGKKEVFFWCMNLLGATIVGIGLSSYMYVRYINPDTINLVYMAIEMMTFAAIIFISALIAGRMNAKRVRRRRAVYTDAAPDEADRERHESSAGMEEQRLAQSYIDEAAEEASRQISEDADDEPQEKFKMVVKGRG